MKKTISVLCLIIFCIGILSSCNKDNNPDMEISGAEYLAQGTIPASAKLYPVVRDDMPMNTVYEGDAQDSVTDEDIATITTYIDKYAALCNNNAAEDYDNSDLPFLSGFMTQSLLDDNEKNEASTILTGCQIITLVFLSGTEAEALVLTNSEGVIGNMDGKSMEGTFTQLTSKSLTKINDNWYIIGSKSEFFGNADEYAIERDPIDGKIYVNPAE